MALLIVVDFLFEVECPEAIGSDSVALHNSDSVLMDLDGGFVKGGGASMVTELSD